MGMSSQELFKHLQTGKVDASDVLLALARESVVGDDLKFVPIICSVEATIMPPHQRKVSRHIAAIVCNDRKLGFTDDAEGFISWCAKNPTWSADLKWAATRSEFPNVVRGMERAIRAFGEERRRERAHNRH